MSVRSVGILECRVALLWEWRGLRHAEARTWVVGPQHAGQESPFRNPMQPLPINRSVLFPLFLSIALAGALGSCAQRTVQSVARTAALQSSAVTTGQEPEPILGLSSSELSSRLGHPFAIRTKFGEGAQYWIWKDREGQSMGLHVAGGIVVQIPANFIPSKIVQQLDEALPASLGEPVVDLLARLGNASSLVMEGSRATPGSQPAVPYRPYLVYGDHWICIDQSVVVGINDPIVAPPQYGPR